MKYYRILFLAAALTGLASCAVDPLKEFEVEKPKDIAQYEYLNEYDVLKNYVDRTASPDFKLGAALTASDFTAKGQVYALAVSNFDEMTAGNAMKYASVVGDKGDMSFDNVRNFVNAASEAGMTVYGHTLAWHSQQNNKYLNSLIADKEIEVDPNAPANSYIEYTCGDAGANPWDKQATYMLTTPMVKDETYVVTVDVKSEEGGNIALWPIWAASPNLDQWNNSADVQYLAEATMAKDFAPLTWEFKASFPHDKLQFCFGKVGGKVGFDNLVVVKKGTEENLASNGDFAEPKTTGWGNNWNGPTYAIAQESNVLVDLEILEYSIDYSKSAYTFWNEINDEVKGTTTIGKNEEEGVLEIKSSVAASQNYFVQYHIADGLPTVADQQYVLKVVVRGSDKGTIAGGVGPWSGRATTNISFDTEWKEVSVPFTAVADGGHVMAQTGSFVGTVQIKSVEIYRIEKSNTIPLSPEEKKAALSTAMDNWIKGMMEVTATKVSAWDVVNEAISGVDANGDGKYDLQSAKNGDAKNNFYWQDYLGDEEYVRFVVAKAREYYAEFGGTEPLKLFINDYNLESDWDQNKKLKSLIKWVEIWESDGVTKIDGLATQMHVSCYANPQTQASKKAAVVEMFKLMAATGKLVKVSELDMGYVDANGNTVPTTSMTEAQHQAMAEYYEFIVSEYFKNVPAAQRYGITQWCLTDASGELGTGWRGGEPVGLWDQSYNRKHTYAGFAEGLKAE